MQGGDDEYSKVGLTARGEMLKGKWALITGASRGVGWTIAEKFASEQANLILVARSKDDLEKVLPAGRWSPLLTGLISQNGTLTAFFSIGVEACTHILTAHQHCTGRPALGR